MCNRGVAFFVALILNFISAAPVPAQPLVFKAILAPIAEERPTADVKELPFLGAGTSGWATLTIDPIAQTISYLVIVVDAPTGVIGRLQLAMSGNGLRTILTFSPPVATTVTLNRIDDDICYAEAALSFQDTVAAADLLRRSGQGVRSTGDLVEAIQAGRLLVSIGSAQDHTQWWGGFFRQN